MVIGHFSLPSCTLFKKGQIYNADSTMYIYIDM